MLCSTVELKLRASRRAMMSACACLVGATPVMWCDAPRLSIVLLPDETNFLSKVRADSQGSTERKYFQYGFSL